MMTCEENTRRLAANGADDSIGIPFDTDLIKCCPMCGVPIEKDEGCAQMMCKRCKHVFCWYCLASLDVSIWNYRQNPVVAVGAHHIPNVQLFESQIIWILFFFLISRMIFCYVIMTKGHVKINWAIHVLRLYGIERKWLEYLPVLVYYCWLHRHYSC